MFINVDLPAPFSPSSACTSPRRRSKSTLSLATTPGKRLVIPFSSRRGASVAFMSRRIVRGRAFRPPPVPASALLDVFGLRRRIDRAVLQLLLRRGGGVLDVLWDDRRELGQELGVRQILHAVKRVR